MRIKNYVNYGMCVYQSCVTENDAFKLGDVVINFENQIGVIIQVHTPDEFRTDMFGNASSSEIRMAKIEEVELYRPNIMKEGKFIHNELSYTAVRSKEKFGSKLFITTDVFHEKSGEKVCTFPYFVRQPRYGSKSIMINGWKHPIKQWMKT